MISRSAIGIVRARKLGVSRGVVQRVLGTPGTLPVVAPVDVPDDFDEVQVEFNQMVEQARASNTVDGWRSLHKVARTCFENGYAVPYGTLPYLISLSTAQAGEDIDSPAGRQRRKGWGLEIVSVYHFMKFYRLANWGKRPPVPVPDDWWEQWVALVESAG